jgi:hypothetical protein
MAPLIHVQLCRLLPENTNRYRTSDATPDWLRTVVFIAGRGDYYPTGWRQLFNGRFSSEWSRIQHAAYEGRPRNGDTSIKRTGDKWQVQLIVHIWTQWERAWNDRNQTVHGNTTTTRNEAIRREVRRQLEVVYQNRHLMEPSIQEILYDQPEDHDRQPLMTTRNWLAQYAPVFKESIRRAKSRALRNVRSIRSYFQSASGG